MYTSFRIYLFDFTLGRFFTKSGKMYILKSAPAIPTGIFSGTFSGSTNTDPKINCLVQQ